jgi:hypothetical protein
MKPGSIVILNLRNPVERLLGCLVDISPSGVSIRGLDLGAFEDWIDDVSSGNEEGLRPTTFFFPMHRVEKVILDEDLGGVPSMANAFLARTGTPVSQYLETP